MKKTRLFEFLGNRQLSLTKRRFNPDAEPNPFFKRKGKMAMIVNLSDEEPDEGMDDFVRGRGLKQGLDRVSRSHVGPHSGVNASRYDDMVRDITDLEFDGRLPSTRNGPEDYFPDDDEDEELFLSFNDKSYKRNEFNDDDDAEDFDADAGWSFMRTLGLEDDDDDMDDDEFYAEDDEDLSPEEDELSPEDEEDELSPEDDLGDEESRYDGIVRNVAGAYLVSKKRMPDETFTEVWVYNVGKKFEDESNIRKSILSGTDIDPTKNVSEDGAQEASLSTIGNVQYLTITGLSD